MPKLWNSTITAHRHAVQDAIMNAAWSLATERGLSSVTMSQIAERAGIGRATLYKYFPNVEAILVAGHQRHVSEHLERLTEIASGSGDARERLKAVLDTFAMIAHQRKLHAAELSALLHRGEEVVEAQRKIQELIRQLLTELADAGTIRRDIPLEELASFCLHGLTAAASLPRDGIPRLVQLTLAALEPETRSDR